MLRGLSILSSFIIMFVNNVLIILIQKVTNYEKRSTDTHFQLGVAEKLCLVGILI